MLQLCWKVKELEKERETRPHPTPVSLSTNSYTEKPLDMAIDSTKTARGNKLASCDMFWVFIHLPWNCFSYAQRKLKVSCQIFYVCENTVTVAVFRHTPEEGIRSHDRWLWATMWLLGIELRTSGRAASALNGWAISPAHQMYLIYQSYQVLWLGNTAHCRVSGV